jgi:isopentenyl diphosphate isomerase/L-lactate dehydrogenase-like FMN-dependent dehydrogenase
MCGVAGPFLKAATTTVEAVRELVTLYASQLRVAMFAAGAADIPALQHAAIVHIGP